MAITKIWAVKDDLRRVLNYIENPDKTKKELSDGLKEVLAYTTQGYKTNEKEYITGINKADDEYKAFLQQDGWKTCLSCSPIF